MARTGKALKESNFNLRVDPALKAAFLRAVAVDGVPAAEVLRDYMRDYVARRARLFFEAEALRQASLVAAQQTSGGEDFDARSGAASWTG